MSAQDANPIEWLAILRLTPTADVVAHSELLLAFAQRTVFGHWFIAAARLAELVIAERSAPSERLRITTAEIDQLVTALDRLAAFAFAASSVCPCGSPTNASDRSVAACFKLKCALS